MAKIKFQNGQVVDFKGQPTEADIEEVAQKLGIGGRKQPTPPQEQGKSTLNKVAGFLGIEKFGKRIGSELVKLTPEGRDLKKLLDSGKISEAEYKDITTGGVSNREALASGAMTVANLALPFAGKALQVGSKAVKLSLIHI